MIRHHACRRPLRDAPLAMCDALSVPTGDMLLSDLSYRHRKGEIQLMQHKPKQRPVLYAGAAHHRIARDMARRVHVAATRMA